MSTAGEDGALVEPTCFAAEPHTQVISIALHPTGSLLALGLKRIDRRWVEVRTTDGWELRGRFAFPNWPTRMAFSSSGGWLGVAGGGPMIMLWDLSGDSPRRVARQILEGRPLQQLASVGFNPDAAFFCAPNGAIHRVGFDGDVKADWYTPPSGAPELVPAFAASGEFVVCGTTGGVQVLAVASGESVWKCDDWSAVQAMFHDDGSVTAFDFFERTLQRFAVPEAASPCPTGGSPRLAGSVDWDADYYRDVPERLFAGAADSYLASLDELEQEVSDKDPALVARFREILVPLCLIFNAHTEVVDNQARLQMADTLATDDRSLVPLGPLREPRALSPDRLIDQLQLEDLELEGDDWETVLAEIHGAKVAKRIVGMRIMVRGAWQLERALRQCWLRKPVSAGTFASQLRDVDPWDRGPLALYAARLAASPDPSPVRALLRDGEAPREVRAAAALALAQWGVLEEETLGPDVLEEAKTLHGLLKLYAIRLRML